MGTRTQNHSWWTADFPAPIQLWSASNISCDEISLGPFDSVLAPLSNETVLFQIKVSMKIEVINLAIKPIFQPCIVQLLCKGAIHIGHFTTKKQQLFLLTNPSTYGLGC
jgi:hypothetical protein